MTHYVIIGAGPTGLSFAHRILSQGSDAQVTVIDQAPFPGGSGASFNWEGHTLDLGPHAFHTRGGEAETLIRSLYKIDPDSLVTGKKHVSIFLKRRFFKYPLQVREALFKFNPLLSLRIFLEFFLTSAFHALVSLPIDNFEMWGQKRFGPTLYKLGFGDYSQKVWKTPPDKISVKFAAEKIQGFSFLNLMKKLLKIGGEVTEPYYQSWIYPRRGSGETYRRLVGEIERMGGSVFLGACLKELVNENGRIGTITYERNGESFQLEPDVCISTITLPRVIPLLRHQPDYFITHSARKLKTIDLILVYLELPREQLTTYHWFYLLDPEFHFNRITEQKHLSVETILQGKTVISMELTCRAGDSTWNLSDDELVALAEKDLGSLPGQRDLKSSRSLVKRVHGVYEIYYRNFDQHVDTLLSYLLNYSNFFITGRRGLFLQCDQHHAISMGLELADLLLKSPVSRNQLEDYYRKYVRYFTHESVLGQ